MPEEAHGVLAFTICLQGGTLAVRRAWAAAGARLVPQRCLGPWCAGGNARGANPAPAGAPPARLAGLPTACAAGGGDPTQQATQAAPAARTCRPYAQERDRPRWQSAPRVYGAAVRILDKADELGMVAIGYFYPVRPRLKDEEAVKRGVLNATN
jgi:hypothetical protein